MALFQVAVPQELVGDLEESFYQGPMLNAAGIRRLDEELVDRLNKMSIVIQSDEHPPPHFHVKFSGQNVSFSIADGTRLTGGLERYEHNIRRWWKDHRCTLIRVWNKTRPTDCPVGPVPVPPECPSGD
ncbi:DUF4160 domain-containing protein [Azospirillum sp. TSO5]|uniref:DUF4160 domain-containing protein n=1 Tax=Azospirillum sp. TSO5 TaxID=716760 RepID=UPI000D6133BE|nr:DUF4160 domain-containing protein [Azospirillum sp. TSO5]PWC92657.1 hypothetical protein TSO5_17205 [Azospirillum sp. TSO5]